jgi:hypothetical protein
MLFFLTYILSDSQENKIMRREILPANKFSRGKVDIYCIYYLKVHKNENFFGFDFEFCTISLLVMHK